jgi:hypothetical protein
MLFRFTTLFAAVIGIVAPTPSHAGILPAQVSVHDFKLDKKEAAKGEVVTASWSYTGKAKRVTIATAAPDGVLLPYSWPATPVSTGELTFTVPVSLYTLSPLVVVLNIDGKFLNSVPLLITCDHPWFFTPRAERCPSVPVKPTAAAMQMFEGGRMFWLKDRDAIFVMYNYGPGLGEEGRWETFIDNFDEGDPETDPAIAPPVGKLQPKRGFGLVWRTQPRVRERLGWALTGERAYTACVGGGFGGWKSYRSYVNDADNRILQLDSYYMPATWNLYDVTQGQTVVFTGCAA